jgi:23S rRNA pseudouridine2605 synthase
MSDESSTSERGERLQKRMAFLGIASRRESETLITSGRVTVNGRRVTELGTRVQLEDVIALDGRPALDDGTVLVVLLNKPIGVICTRKDPEGRETIYDIIDPALPWLAHVGRLDIMTEGCLLLTNDGELAERLLLPATGVPRVYQVKVRGRIDRKTLEKLSAGVVLDGRRTRPSSISRVRSKSKHDWLELTLVEGRNRHVRRIFEAVGHSVTRLRRLSFAGITVEGLGRGNWRLLEPREIAQLRSFGS